MKKLSSYLGSLKLGIVLICLFAIVLIVATFFESSYGTRAVQYSIYKTAWFGLLLILIAINVTFAALKKYPWKKHQVGFVITHLGILVMIVGSFISFWFGVEGNLPLYNNEEKDYMLSDEQTLTLEIPQKNISLTKILNLGPYVKKGALATFSPDPTTEVRVDTFLPYAKVEESIVEDKTSNYEGIKLHLKNPFAAFDQWLLMNETGNEELQVGPATLIFKKLKDASSLHSFLHTKTASQKNSLGELKLTIHNQHWTLPISSSELSKTIPLNGSAFKLKNFQYFSDAQVQNGKLVNRSETLTNPALQFVLEGPEGSEKYISFTNFPNFSSMHQKTTVYNAKVEFMAHDSHVHSSQQHTLYLAVTPNQKLYYKVSSAKENRSGEIVVGKSYDTGWMDLTFTAEQFFPHATKKSSFSPFIPKDPNNPKALPALHLSFFKNGTLTHKEWLEFYENKHVVFEGEHYTISYLPKILPLYFSLHLKQFEMGTDPGTNNPATYKSHVTLKGSAAGGIVQDHLVTMNEPLTHKKFTFYQSSYQNDEEGRPIGSVLSVMYDPGRSLKYAGSLLIVLGILWMFFFKKIYMEAAQEYLKKKETLKLKPEETHAF